MHEILNKIAQYAFVLIIFVPSLIGLFFGNRTFWKSFHINIYTGKKEKPALIALAIAYGFVLLDTLVMSIFPKTHAIGNILLKISLPLLFLFILWFFGTQDAAEEKERNNNNTSD